MKRHFFTLWIGFICLAAFLFQNIFNGLTDMLVLNNKAVYNFEIWRFATAIFIHGSLSHLLFNLFALIVFGLILERAIGERNFLLIFFFSGIIANLISVNFYDSSLGASGAIMGIIGCLTILNPMMMVWAFGILMPMFIAAVVWIFMDIVGVFMPSGAGNIAHLSGIAIGFVFGILIRIFYAERKVFREKIKISEDYARNWEKRFIEN